MNYAYEGKNTLIKIIFQMIKASPFVTGLGLTLTFILFNQDSFASQTSLSYKSKATQHAPKPKYKYHEASTLSGINIQPDKKNGTFILKFDQYLTELGVLHVINNSGKVVYAKSLEPTKESATHTMNVGRLNPGIYSIEVKTSDTTFWKKVRIKK